MFKLTLFYVIHIAVGMAILDTHILQAGANLQGTTVVYHIKLVLQTECRFIVFSLTQPVNKHGCASQFFPPGEGECGTGGGIGRGLWDRGGRRGLAGGYGGYPRNTSYNN